MTISYTSSPEVTPLQLEAIVRSMAMRSVGVINIERSYMADLLRHKNIQRSRIHIVVNPGALDPTAASEIVYAFVLQRPIILFFPPVFTDNVPIFVKKIICEKLDKILLCNVSMLDEQDLSGLLAEVKNLDRVNYTLTRHETLLIKGSIRAHFRDALS